MWRFTRINGGIEGFPNKMELITRQAYDFRNFEKHFFRWCARVDSNHWPFAPEANALSS